jgi:hypothetical protein
MYWQLGADDPGFHLDKGDIVEGLPVPDDPGSASNPEGRVRILRRLYDNYSPGCTLRWVDLEQLRPDDQAVKDAVIEGALRAMNDPELEKPRLLVLAAGPRMAQREIAELRLGELFVPHYVSEPHRLRGARRFMVLPSFGGRPMKWVEAEQWQYELDLLRRQLHTQEFTLADVEKARRQAT